MYVCCCCTTHQPAHPRPASCLLRFSQPAGRCNSAGAGCAVFDQRASVCLGGRKEAPVWGWRQPCSCGCESWSVPGHPCLTPATLA